MTERTPLVLIGGVKKQLPAGDTLAKSIVGLGRADNTPDLEKPVSQPVQDALGQKADLDSGGKLPIAQLPALSTSSVSEGSNLYYTDARVRSVTLNGVVFTVNSAVVASDSLLAAIGKIQTQLNNRLLTTGTAAAATKLATARTINGVNFDGTANITIVDSSRIATALMGAPNGVATLDTSGMVPASQLPSYVDDVLEYPTFSALPATGEPGKIYITVTPYTDANGVTSSQFRWSGSAYAPIIASPGSTDAVTEGSTNVYFTEARVRSTALFGFTVGGNAALAAGDTFLQAFGKLQAQLNNKLASTGTAAAATKLATARSIGLSGDASGSVNFDGSAAVTISVTIAQATKLRTARLIGGAAFDGTADIEVNANWMGNTAEAAMPTGTANYSARAGRAYIEGIYGGLAKGFPIDFGNRIQICGHGLAVTEVYTEWTSGRSRMFVRARGDVNTHVWTTPREVAFMDTVQSLSDANLSRSGGPDSAMTGELQSSAINFFRATSGNYGTIFRQDPSYFYLLVTAKDDKQGGWTTQRPLTLNLETGVLGINGNAGTASKLANARKINGVNFDGSSDIIITDDTKEPSIGGGTSAQYWRGDKTWQDLPKFVRDTAIAGVSFATNAAIAATDSVLSALGKLQAQINAAQGLLIMAPFDAFAMWHFDKGDTEGWIASGATLNGAGGSLTVTSTTADPYIVSPVMALPGALFTVLRMKITRKAGSGWDGKFYSRTASHSWGNYYKQVPNPNLAVGQSVILDVDMAALTLGGTDWVDNIILQVRLDLGASTADVFDVDWVGIGRVAPNRASLPLSGGRMIGALDEAPNVTVALSNGVLDAASAQANTVTGTGNGNLTSFGTAQEGVTRKILFAGAMTIQNTNIQLPNGLATLVTEFGDSCEILGMPGNAWKLLYYTRYSGRPLRPANLVNVSELGGPYRTQATGQVKIGSLSCTITTGNNPIQLTYNLVVQHAGSNNSGIMIKRNGVQLSNASWIIPGPDTNFNYKQGSIIDQPGAGTWTYEFYWNVETTVDSLSTVTATDSRFTRFIVAQEIFT
ncbi:hypothetical protein AHFPHNDE_01183 [Pseudomonas sp. MM227]|uniref:phage tail fiber protein n=1 Tax=Pseudomonas sp. MM227 TaxID=3019968 RepID=UPI00221F0ECE|nr:hypothetical protein [Pseudomonas sp. MM227]CAI3787519.1 hypothetical protein AHFPHNDE_01183 [Pseudomonas sp. MM227]